jgi:hypothetical protein
VQMCGPPHACCHITRSLGTCAQRKTAMSLCILCLQGLSGYIGFDAEAEVQPILELLRIANEFQVCTGAPVQAVPSDNSGHVNSLAIKHTGMQTRHMSATVCACSCRKQALGRTLPNAPLYSAHPARCCHAGGVRVVMLVESVAAEGRAGHLSDVAVACNRAPRLQTSATPLLSGAEFCPSSLQTWQQARANSRTLPMITWKVRRCGLATSTAVV